MSPATAMFRQESPAAPTSNGAGELQRSSWKAEAIRRGNLKISGPIPITEDTPLNEEEEQEYAAKHDISLVPERPQTPPQEAKSKSLDAGSHLSTSDRIDSQPEVQESPHTLRHKRSSTAIRAVSEMQRHTSPDLSASYNSPSPFPSLPDSTSKMTPRKKRRSGLRNVFRKMFGRKGKDDQENSAQRHGYHQSDPGTLTRLPEETRENPSAEPQISGLQVRDLQPINPLGSHLPFPMNVNAPEQASPPHEYLTFEPPPNLGRRRATLPSIVLSASEVEALSATWGSSGTKVTSLDEHTQGKPESIPSPQIGVAISNPSQDRRKRRSQSAGALRDIKIRQEREARRRSAEIRYWRSSTADRSVSVYSSHTPRSQTVETMGTPNHITQVIADEVCKPISPTLPEPVTQDEKIISPIPVELFNFGNLKSDFPDTPREEETVLPAEPRLSLEERVERLESRTQGLESSIQRLTGRSNRQTIILESAPKGRRSDRSPSTTRERKSSTESSKGSNKALSTRLQPGPPSPALASTFLTSPSPVEGGASKPTSSQDQAKSLSQNHEVSRTLGPSAIPRLNNSQQTSDPAEQFAAVSTILQHERSARKALEKQVISLQREVSDLRALVNKFISATPYPTPSPDAIIHSTAEERLSTPRASRRAPAKGLGFESDEEQFGASARRVPDRERIISRFSLSESEGGDEQDEAARSGSSKDDVTSPDVWATPREEKGYGFFNHSATDDEMF